MFVFGILIGLAAGYFFKLPLILHVTVAVGLAVAVAAIWGGLAGYIKARFRVHEVISTIMLNWIALYLSNFVITLKAFGSQGTGNIFNHAFQIGYFVVHP